ncbi:MAG TPA: putative toxin-antitoxin system toxin component, PIN family [Anaerolineales bacterium]|nr:putative toxin-antitoxin system toxin component, PIN family [Anaerolineales bacterium]HNC89922.1 putative toxin-antitoxin system toxin component, PIN family [Anaerolineales bacterium]HND92694.1 putative toxin-antitoxin system toxin component, PIN family [Anaerolineales bacterium]HNE69269.1 putative toxin-antitoxin system toxin component, PIN family [Anaerolineales bacterium]HNF35608.1 putative toxin-antitoxin system toxin component, PIN family [Anaerolineales bacterium]
MKRAVLDTNILISSALGGALVLVLEKWDAGVFSVVVTTDILSEYFEVLNRPKFGLKQETIDKITTYIYQFSEFVIPEEKIRFIEDDPKDDKFLEAAIAGNVDFIVSGDKHLLDLKEFRSVPILSGREFLDWLQRNGN